MSSSLAGRCWKPDGLQGWERSRNGKVEAPLGQAGDSGVISPGLAGSLRGAPARGQWGFVWVVPPQPMGARPWPSPLGSPPSGPQEGTAALGLAEQPMAQSKEAPARLVCLVLA